MALLALAAWTPASRANPEGLAVVSGCASAWTNGSHLSLTVSSDAVLDWRRFNLEPGDVTTIHQPSADSVVWICIDDPENSRVDGILHANGRVILLNQSGFYFGANSAVHAASLIVSSVPLKNSVAPDFTSKARFDAVSGSTIVMHGQMEAAPDGSVILVAEDIQNHGVMRAPGGVVRLCAGKEVLLSEWPDGCGLSASVRLPAGSIDNTGQLIADAGTVALHAQVVNQNGDIQANSVRERQGMIALVASEAVNLGANSLLQASGSADTVSDGGSIHIQSAQTLTDQCGSWIKTSGGAQGGNGGAVEICATRMDGFHSRIEAAAQPGWTGGRLLFDPYNLTLSGVDDGVSINVNSAFLGLAQITLEATHDITLTDGTVWDLNASTGISGAGSLLRLEAGNSIFFGDNARIAASGGWSVQLSAGMDFALPVPAVRNGIGGIYLNGATGGNNSGAIQATDGNITLEGGHEILVGRGFIRTAGGGSINLRTGDGDVDAGTKSDGYVFSRSGYAISPAGLGGIGTAAGGNVSINAGGDILGFFAPIGAFGSQAGEVSLTAGRSVFGNFMVRNGTGTMQASLDAGSQSSPVSLGLVSGGWNVNAGWDVFLNEIYNPNGVLNPNRVLYGARIAFQFDYALDAYANLVGSNSVHLLGNNLARVAQNAARPAIYAPCLSVMAGAGGVELGNDLVLYPSAQGRLNIMTAGGGSLFSTPGAFNQIVVSDSGSPVYTTFISGHAATPLHLNTLAPTVSLDISDDLRNLFVRSPSRTDMNIAGDAVNFSFEGQNLSANDVTRLQIGGMYFSRSDLTFETLADTPNLAVFTDPFIAVNLAMGARLTWNPVMHLLGFQGMMTGADLDALLHIPWPT